MLYGRNSNFDSYLDSKCMLSLMKMAIAVQGLVVISSITKFLVTFSLVLHTCSKFGTFLVNSFNNLGNFTCSIKGKSSILGRNRCYRLWPLMTALVIEATMGTINY